jgi:hypothetical protein
VPRARPPTGQPPYDLSGLIGWVTSRQQRNGRSGQRGRATDPRRLFLRRKLRHSLLYAQRQQGTRQLDTGTAAGGVNRRSLRQDEGWQATTLKITKRSSLVLSANLVSCALSLPRARTLRHRSPRCVRVSQPRSLKILHGGTKSFDPRVTF